MGKYNYPGADLATQKFSDNFPSDVMDTNVATMHSTEGVSWPGYSGGKTAPNYTFYASIKERKGYWREHFAANLSSRALENRAGGVQTNTLNNVQVEMIGTCDSRYARTWGNMKAGVDYIYWPDAPQWALDELAKFLKWLASVCPRFEVKDGSPRGWVRYPDSYGLNAKQRMTFAEWNASSGIVGHQHVPENVHGDPGDLNIKALVAAATGVTVPTTPPVTPPRVIVDPMDPKNYFLGAKGDYVTEYGKRVVIWSEHLELKKPYVIGPGPNYTETDRAATSLIQVALGYDVINGKKDPKQLLQGGTCDGFPGTVTLTTLFSDPPAKPVRPETVDVSVMFVPTAGYNAATAEGVTNWKANSKGLRALVTSHRPDVFGTTELSGHAADPMRQDFDANLADYKRYGGSDGRFAFEHTKTVKHIAAGKIEAPAKTLLNGDTKQAAWDAFEIDGLRLGIIVGHTENQNGVDKDTRANADDLRVDQMGYFVAQGLKQLAAVGVDDDHVIVLADTNSEAMVKDAMVAAGWTAIGPGYFTRWDDTAKKSYDWAFIKGGKASFIRINHDFGDHTALLIVWTVTK